MSHLQLSAVRPAQPPWLKPVVLILGGLIMAIAGLMSVTTQAGLAERIPDWAEFGWLLPVACWLYTALSTIIWAATPEGSETHDKAFRGVVLAAGISELMNVGEHAWLYVDTSGKLDEGFLPIFLVGSLPTALEVLSVHLIAEALSRRTTEETVPSVPELSAQAELSNDDPNVPGDLPATNLPNEGDPEPVLPKEPPAPRNEDPKAKDPKNDDPAPKTGDEDVPHLPERRLARKKLVEDVALIAAEMLRDGKAEEDVKKALSATEMADRFPHHTYTDRNWLNIRKDALAVANELVEGAA